LKAFCSQYWAESAAFLDIPYFFPRYHSSGRTNRPSISQALKGKRQNPLLEEKLRMQLSLLISNELLFNSSQEPLPYPALWHR
jgi:hypothetical protein